MVLATCNHTIPEDKWNGVMGRFLGCTFANVVLKDCTSDVQTRESHAPEKTLMQASESQTLEQKTRPWVGRATICYSAYSLGIHSGPSGFSGPFEVPLGSHGSFDFRWSRCHFMSIFAFGIIWLKLPCSWATPPRGPWLCSSLRATHMEMISSWGKWPMLF